MNRRFAPPSLVCSMMFAACNSPQTKLCHEKMAEAQTAVNGVDSNSADSLTRSIQLVALATDACKVAGRDSEVKQLEQARERLAGHRSLVEDRDARKKAKEALTPQELERLVREGDPSCPRGQAYQSKIGGKQIRCTGLQPIELGWEQARRYFSSRNFRGVPGSDETVLTMESGSEKYVLHYEEKGSATPPKCMVIYPRPGISWQEAVARITGVPPERLRDGSTVSVAQGKLSIKVDQKNEIVRVGDCSK